MRTPRDHRDIGSAARQPRGEMAADRTGAEDTYLQDSISNAARDNACTPNPMQASSG